MPIHTVEQGEHISGITADYGFSDYHIIWDDAKNAELAKIRDPHVLFPGDEIFVPTKILKQETGATGKTHDFQVKEVPLYLCLRLRDLDEAPIKTAPYQLNLDLESAPRTGATNGDGILIEKISPRVKEAAL